MATEQIEVEGYKFTGTPPVRVLKAVNTIGKLEQLSPEEQNNPDNADSVFDALEVIMNFMIRKNPDKADEIADLGTEEVVKVTMEWLKKSQERYPKA